MGNTMTIENKIKLVTGVKGVEFSPRYTKENSLFYEIFETSPYC